MKPLIAEYVPEGVDDETKGFQVSATFKSRHLIQTQYMTIVLKCDDPLCCSPFKTEIDRFFPGRRVPPLIPIKFSTSGPVALDLEPNVHQKKLNFLDVFARLVMEKQLLPANLKTKYNGKVPYDVYFPTLQTVWTVLLCENLTGRAQENLQEEQGTRRRPRCWGGGSSRRGH